MKNLEMQAPSWSGLPKIQMKAACASWKIHPCDGVDSFWSHFTKLVTTAADQGAELLVMPELITLELEGVFEDISKRPQDRQLVSAEDLSFRSSLAVENKMTIVAGSLLVEADGEWVNRTLVFSPDGSITHQDKIVMTQFEGVEWGISGGADLMPHTDPRLGVLICYDSEFPELGRTLSEKGVLALCVPSYTETWHGHWRVRHSCHARAVENQIFVLHAPLVGSLGREPVPQSHGTPAILAPCNAPFPFNGILAEGPADEETVVFADLDFDVLLASREEGDVRNWNDRLQVRRFLP